MSDITLGSELRKMTRSLKIRSIRNPRTAASTVLAGFVSGLAQMGSAGTTGAVADFPIRRSEDGFRSDWNRVGGDMKRGMEKVRAGEKAKA